MRLEKRRANFMTASNLWALAEIAVEAGAIVLTHYQAGAGSTVKADGSPVTAADVAAEAHILTRLKAIAPDVPIVSEEAAGGRLATGPARQFFLVDPLDGTKEFLKRNGEFTVNIALIEDEAPLSGVVYAPALGILYAGAAGRAYSVRVEHGRVGEAHAMCARQPQPGGLDVVASRSHMTPETRGILSSLTVRNLVQAGSSLKFCRIAEGAADLYPRLGRTMEWDTAAGDAVLRAAGGHVLTLEGAPLRYGKRGQAHDAEFANPSFIACGRFDPFALPGFPAAKGSAC
jgi:3'(2'),5'-bisphosphate nucleotidase